MSCFKPTPATNYAKYFQTLNNFQKIIALVMCNAFQQSMLWLCYLYHKMSINFALLVCPFDCRSVYEWDILSFFFIFLLFLIFNFGSIKHVSNVNFQPPKFVRIPKLHFRNGEVICCRQR